MANGLILKGQTLTFTNDPFLVGSDEATKFDTSGAVWVDGGRIKDFGTANDILGKAVGVPVIDYVESLISAGFVDHLLVSFSDTSESMVSLKSLRERCPCASCEGETDALGNLYKGPEQVLNPSSFQISGLQPVGYYGLRPFWKDGHTTGIFTGTLLKKLSK